MSITAEQATAVLQAGIKVSMYHGGEVLPEDEKKLVSEAEDMLELVAQVCKVAAFNGPENTPNWASFAEMMTLVGQDPEQELAKARGEVQAPAAEPPAPAAPNLAPEPSPAPVAPTPVPAAPQPVQAVETPQYPPGVITTAAGLAQPPAPDVVGLTSANSHVKPEPLPPTVIGEIWEGPDGQTMRVEGTVHENKVPVLFKGSESTSVVAVPRAFLVRKLAEAPAPSDADYAGPPPPPPIGSGNPVEHQVAPQPPVEIIALPAQPVAAQEVAEVNQMVNQLAADRGVDPMEMVMTPEVSPPTVPEPVPEIRAIEVEPPEVQSVGGFGAMQPAPAAPAPPQQIPTTHATPTPEQFQQAVQQPVAPPAGGFTAIPTGFGQTQPAPPTVPVAVEPVQQPVAQQPVAQEVVPVAQTAPATSQELVPANQEEVVQGELVFPLHNSDGDEQYKHLLDEVEDRRTPSGFPVPREFNHSLPIIPEDSTNLSDSALKDLHLQFNALAARARFLHDLESDYARACGAIRDGYYRKAVKAARAEMGKDATLEEVKHEAEEDENVRTWTERREKHQAEARSFKTYFDINSDNVKVLSRDWTMRDKEQQGA